VLDSIGTELAESGQGIILEPEVSRRNLPSIPQSRFGYEEKSGKLFRPVGIPLPLDSNCGAKINTKKVI